MILTNPALILAERDIEYPMQTILDRPVTARCLGKGFSGGDALAGDIEGALARELTVDFPLSLDEFCSQISITDKRVEAIGAFHATEKAAGRVKDTFPAYSGRYTAFLAKPM